MSRENPRFPSQTTNYTAFALCFLYAIGIALFLSGPLDAETVTYRLEVDNTWSQETHLGRMPPERAHFSWLGGGTHNDRISFWQEGKLASPSMVEMAETGVIDMLVGEINQQYRRGQRLLFFALSMVGLRRRDPQRKLRHVHC